MASDFNTVPIASRNTSSDIASIRSKNSPYAKYTLATLILIAALGTSIANFALPSIAMGFDVTFSEAKHVVVAYLVAMTLSAVFVGRLGDVLGLRAMLMSGITIFLIGSLGCIASPTLNWLIIARAIQGIGAAVLSTMAMALMRDVVNSAQVGRAMGLLGTASAIGTALGPMLGGIILPHASWREVFMMLIPLSMVALFASRVFIRTQVETPSQKIAPFGLPNIPHSVLINSIVNLVVATMMMCTLVLSPFYLTSSLGVSDLQLGIIMAIGPVISVVAGIVSGRLIDKFSAKIILACGLCLLLIGTLFLSILPMLFGVVGYVISIAFLTTGYQSFQASNNMISLENVAQNQRGTTSGLLNFSRNLGLILGAGWMSGVFFHSDKLSNAAHLAIQTEGAFSQTFLLGGGMLSLVVVLLYFSMRLRKNNKNSANGTE